MPECHVVVRWPDGSRQRVYSPSLVVTERLAAAAPYPVPELVARLRGALGEASDRVRAIYGFPCSLAAASIVAVEQRSAPWVGDDAARATVERFET